MDEVKVNGVFLHSKNLDSEYMLKCLQMLVNNFPGIKITSVVSDELHFGYKVYFSSPKEDAVLARKHLIISGENIRIGPLRTFLTIHSVRKNADDRYETELRETIWNKFGKFLDFDLVSSPESEITKTLRVCVDVPEIEELEIFNCEGYPDMYLCLPSNNEMLKVTFHCKRCNNDGHILQNCSMLTPSKEETKEETSATIDFKKFTSVVAKPIPMKLESPHTYAEKEVSKTGNFTSDVTTFPMNKAGIFTCLYDKEIRKEEALEAGNFTSDVAKPFSIKLESPHAYDEKITREERTGILPGRNQNDKEDKTRPSSTSVKVTPEKFPFSFKINIEVDDDDNPTNAKNSENLNDVRSLVYKPFSLSDVNEDKITNSNDDDVLVLDCQKSTSNNSYSFTFKPEIKEEEMDSKEDIGSATKFLEDLLSSSTHSMAGPSSKNRATPSKFAVENTKILSPQLQVSINSACEECGIDRDKLDTFLIRVKKVCNPSQIARYFTKNPGKLKTLLVVIKKKFYNTPHSATKEDKQFINWITRLVGRFEGSITKKRKSSDQNNFNSPNKK